MQIDDRHKTTIICALLAFGLTVEKTAEILGIHIHEINKYVYTRDAAIRIDRDKAKLAEQAQKIADMAVKMAREGEIIDE